MLKARDGTRTINECIRVSQKMSKIFEKVIEFVNIIIYFYHLLYYVINYEVSKIISAGLCKNCDRYILTATNNFFGDFRDFQRLEIFWRSHSKSCSYF